MILLRRALIILLWTAAMYVLLAALSLVFIFGDCTETDQACLDVQDRASRLLPMIVAGVYGIGLGVLLQRWFLGKR